MVRARKEIHMAYQEMYESLVQRLDEEPKEAVRRIRAAAGMSQGQFHTAYGVPRRTLQDWEAGRRIPPAYVVELLARAVAQDLTSPSA